MSPLSRRIFTLFCLTLLALGETRAASAQQGQRLNLVRDAEIEGAIRTFVTPIWRVAGLDPEAVDIVLVQDNSLNAFVAGGQRIFINTGLLMRTTRPNQLIGVLAHESGHISGGHYNPAVTLAVWLRGKCDTSDVIPYMGAQTAAAVVAELEADALAPEPPPRTSSATAPPPPTRWRLVLALAVMLAMATVVLYRRRRR